MAYILSMKPAFRADFLNLNKDMQKRVNAALEDLEKDPITPRGDTIKRLQHHEHLWRYRIGDSRMVYAVYQGRDLVQILGIGPRGNIYERMGYRPEEPKYPNYSATLEQALDPDKETPANWQEYVRPLPEKDTSRTLPYQITPELLTQWRIPATFHHHFLGCKTEESLLNSGAPDHYILHMVDCLWPATAEVVINQPNLLVQQPEDLSRYAMGNLMDFLLLLDADQEKFVDWGLRGPTLVKGGPGSGKSTVAMYRVRALAEHASQISQKGVIPAPIRVLFTTYTNALVEVSRQLIDHLLEGCADSKVILEASTVDRIAWHIVESCDETPTMADNKDLAYALTSARTAFNPVGKTPLELALLRNALNSLRDDYLIEEIEWVIEGQGLGTLAEYQQADRTGRGYAFDARMREAVWTLYDHTVHFLQTLKKTSWGTLRKKAFDLVKSGKWDGVKWDYVLIDEAQDLTPIALALCVELCRSPEGLFLTADASQSLYNKGFAWKNVHAALRVTGRTRILKRNYRTTRQIATAAASIMHNTGAADDEVIDQFFVHTGPLPVLYSAEDEMEMFLWLAGELMASAGELHMPNSAIAILAPNNQKARDAASMLSRFGLTTMYVSGKDIKLEVPMAKALTIHSAKGLEFPIVAMPYVEKGLLPKDLVDNRADDLEKHLQQERRLLYVGMTRAMRRLFVACRQGLCSSFVENVDTGLWTSKSFH